MAVSLTLQSSTHDNKGGSDHSGSPASLPPPTPLSPHNPYHSTSRPGTAGSDSTNNAAASNNAAANAANEKRKTSRRANTAERRATHNAVERQRRETLNGRFLDLAALLPNLTSVRRPSKSAIVNSSIALIHSQRRSRATAARELRTLYNQFVALKAECDEWRARAGIPPVEEGERSVEWGVLMEYAGRIQDCELEMSEEEKIALRAAALASGGLGGSGGQDEDDDDFVTGGLDDDNMALPTAPSTDGGIDVHQHQPLQHMHAPPAQPMHHHQVQVSMHQHQPQHAGSYAPHKATPTPAQIAHQQHLAQVHAAAQATLQYHQQIQWQQQQPQARRQPQQPVQLHSHHDLVSTPFDNGSEIFADSISMLGGVAPMGAYHGHHHGHHPHHVHPHDMGLSAGPATPPIGVNVKTEWPGFTPIPGVGSYDESVSSGSSSDVAHSPSAASSISGAASPGGIMSNGPVGLNGRSRASSLSLGIPVGPVGGGGQGNISMGLFY